MLELSGPQRSHADPASIGATRAVLVYATLRLQGALAVDHFVRTVLTEPLGESDFYNLD